jgi:hypothetical protein
MEPVSKFAALRSKADEASLKASKDGKEFAANIKLDKLDEFNALLTRVIGTEKEAQSDAIYFFVAHVPRGLCLLPSSSVFLLSDPFLSSFFFFSSRGYPSRVGATQQEQDCCFRDFGSLAS